MRIAFYYPRATRGDGGVTHATRGWMNALRDQGHDVLCLHTGDVGSEALGVESRSVRHVSVRGHLCPVGLEKALLGCDLVWLQSGWVTHNLVAARAARRRRIAYAITPHGAYEPKIRERRSVLKQAWTVAVERRLLGSAAFVHVFFEDEIPHLRALGYRGPTVVAPTGIDVPRNGRWDGGTGGYVLWFGRYDVEHKGLDLLVEAVARLAPSERPVLRLHGPDFRGGRSTTATLVRRHGVERWIRLHGPVHGEAKRRLLRRARLFVYPSRWESMGVAMLEAMSHGVPLVTTSSTHLAPVLRRAGGAVVVPPTVDGVMDGLRRGLGPGSDKLGASALTVAEERFSWPAVGRSLSDELRPLVTHAC